MDANLYQYEWDVTCQTCNKHHTLIAISVNPNKTHITAGRNPRTGKIEQGKNTYKLPCGHTQNVIGIPVRPVPTKHKKEN